MKKIILPIALFTVSFAIYSFRTQEANGFQAAPLNANGPSGGQSGAPGEQNCTSCHIGATQNGSAENLLILTNDIGMGMTNIRQVPLTLLIFLWRVIQQRKDFK